MLRKLRAVVQETVFRLRTRIVGKYFDGEDRVREVLMVAMEALILASACIYSVRLAESVDDNKRVTISLLKYLLSLNFSICLFVLIFSHNTHLLLHTQYNLFSNLNGLVIGPIYKSTEYIITLIRDYRGLKLHFNII